MENPFAHLSKPQRYMVIGGSVIMGGYFMYSHHSKTGSWNPFSRNSANAAGNNATAIDPVTGMAYSQDNVVDPITGQTYLAEADQYGSVALAESSVSAYGQSTASGSGIPVNPASPAPSGSINTPVGSSVYTSNAAWAQAVQAGLEDISGSPSYDGTDIGTALGDYLTQQPLTPAQAQVVSTAIAEFNKPPEGNLQIILKPTPVTPPPPPTHNPGTNPGAKPGAPQHLRVSMDNTNAAQVSWDLPGGVSGVSWHVKNSGPSGITDEFTTNNTIANIGGALSHGLKAKTRYTTVIYGTNKAGTGPARSISFTTK